MKTLLASLLASFVGATLAPLCAATWTVGPPGSGASFTDVQAAIDAAQPGDTILVLPGNYTSFQLTKELAILGAGSGQVAIGSTASIAISGIPAGAEAVLSGFTVIDLPRVEVASVAGSVTLHDVVFAGEPSDPADCADGAGLIVTGAARVVVLSCELHGMRGATAAEALRVVDSEVWIVDSLAQGGSGGAWGSWCSTIGGPGLKATSSDVYVARSALLGGDGSPSPTGGNVGGSGAVALQGSHLKVVGGPGTSFEAGWGSAAFSDVPGAQIDASTLLAQADVPIVGQHLQDPHVWISGGAVFQQTGTNYPTLGASARQATLGAPLTLDVDGNAGALALLGYAPRMGASLLVPGIDGALALDPVFALGFATLALDPSGGASLTFPLPTLPALAGTTAFFQALELVSPAQSAWSNPVLVSIP